MPVPVTARSKTWVCGRSFAGIAASNPAGGIVVYCECCVLSGRGLCDGLVRGLLPTVVCLIECDRGTGRGGPGPLGLPSYTLQYEGWNFNFGNTPLDWIQELLQSRANTAGRTDPSPTYIHNGSGPSRNGHRQ